MKKTLLIILSILLITTTCLLYINNNKVKEQNQGNQLAIVVDGEEVSEFPSKNTATFEKVSCKNDSTGTWNNDTWSLSMNFTNNDACVVYFIENYIPTLPQTGTDLLNDLLTHKDTSIANDDPDANIRYIGTDPNNYVSFNGEKWRIIGAFNNIKTAEEGIGETRLKIIKEISSDTDNWEFEGDNDWPTAPLQEKLNGTFYESLSTEAKSLIGDSVWNLGGSSTYNTNTPEMFYLAERGTSVYAGNPTTWTGKIALMYPSDYGYATNGGTSMNRGECLASAPYNWSWYDSSRDCITNNYIKYLISSEAWTLTHDSSSSENLLYIELLGSIDSVSASLEIGVLPTLYLKSEIQILSGSGSNEDPYILGL